MKDIRIGTIKIASELSGFEREIFKAVQKVLNKAGDLKLGKIESVFKTPSNKQVLKPLEGIGGYCPSSKFIQISIDADHPKFLADKVGAISRSFAHELYHAARFATNVSSPNGTLLECLVDEGLADQFVCEVTGRLPVWNKPLLTAIRSRLIDKFNKIADTKVSDRRYSEWFLKGSSSKNIPKWAGYALGLWLVRGYMKIYKTGSVKDLVAVPAIEIFSSLRRP